MTTSPNPARAGLANGDTLLGFGVRLTRTIEVVTLAAACGYDWLFIDLEHGPTSVETAADLCTAALAAGIAPLARMSEADYSTAARMLDAGAWGILMPHIQRAADASEMVKRLKFPPLGRRSVSYSMPQLGFKALNQAEAVQRFNDEMLLVAMIESAEAVTHADEIAAVSGIDALFVGTNDLAMDLGIPGEVGHPKITAVHNVSFSIIVYKNIKITNTRQIPTRHNKPTIYRLLNRETDTIPIGFSPQFNSLTIGLE